MKVSQPNDIYEQEADRMAKQVMSILEPTVQHKCTGCNKDEKDISQTKKVIETDACNSIPRCATHNS
ncbi:hypothetical protein [Methanomethylovorans hollandica]|uniref:hypothetical protein n=1 Tax=Methanomethylovorans hollandica TaxID=101192 RepID=UPI00155AEC24|nr:hypothetical protein [Methanomethylovorans hollandica]